MICKVFRPSGDKAGSDDGVTLREPRKKFFFAPLFCWNKSPLGALRVMAQKVGHDP
jgi:hypothetical protein